MFQAIYWIEPFRDTVAVSPDTPSPQRPLDELNNAAKHCKRHSLTQVIIYSLDAPIAVAPSAPTSAVIIEPNISIARGAWYAVISAVQKKWNIYKYQTVN